MRIVAKKFIDKVIRELSNYNLGELDESMIVNIPFVISSLYDNLDKCEEFITDLMNHDGYSISYTHDSMYNNGQLKVFIVGVNKYHYILTFNSIDRYYGYCRCTPGMDGYREDKMCCGHHCDASFSAFTLEKCNKIATYQWNGDAHSYWDFEDSFKEKFMNTKGVEVDSNSKTSDEDEADEIKVNSKDDSKSDSIDNEDDNYFKSFDEIKKDEIKKIVENAQYKAQEKVVSYLERELKNQKAKLESNKAKRCNCDKHTRLNDLFDLVDLFGELHLL